MRFHFGSIFFFTPKIYRDRFKFCFSALTIPDCLECESPEQQEGVGPGHDAVSNSAALASTQTRKHFVCFVPPSCHLPLFA